MIVTMSCSNDPVVVLQNPKYSQNVASAIRGCACFGITTLRFTGERFHPDKLDRFPREFRMKDYKTVNIAHDDRPFDSFPELVPVCVELLPGAVSLPQFQHPPNAMYVFGPEDGSVNQVFRRHCHFFVQIPSVHCLNLAAALNVVLYDRQSKENSDGSHNQV